MGKPIIGLNGPPRSGKSYLRTELLKLLPHATVISIHDGLFALMQIKKHPLLSGEHFEDYEAFKQSPFFSRRRVIDFAQTMRERYGDQVFVQICEEQPRFQQAEVVIFDNIGLAGDHRWAARIGDPYLLLRLDTPWSMAEPKKALQRRLAGAWPNDSRSPFLHKWLITAYDSTQMMLLLNYIIDPDSKEDRGPYNEYHKLWHDHFARRSTAESVHS